MPKGHTTTDDLVVTLPLPLAQLYRRAQTSIRGEDRHLHAYYLAEATLKLTASLRIGLVLQAGLEPGSPLSQRLEKLCAPMLGEWVGFLRECTDYLRRRTDAGLLPISDAHDELVAHRAFPAVKAFADAVTSRKEGDHLPLQPQFVRENVRLGVLGFFTILANYRNRVLGHGAPRLPDYYDRAGPLLMEAICEILRSPCLFGNLTMAICRLQLDQDGRAVHHEWRRLTNLASLLFPSGEISTQSAVVSAGMPITPGHVYFVSDRTSVSLHPLVIYYEDRNERERVGFLNDTVVRRQATADGQETPTVRRCEYLDYATGDHLQVHDVHKELTQLLVRLRGRVVSDTEVLELTNAGSAMSTDGLATANEGPTIGDFQLLGELGRGAMGIVYKACQRSLNRTVALKVVPPMLAADPVFLSRFSREISALSRCEHPNLVKIITSGTEGDRHYYAMELVEGVDLAALYHYLRSPNGHRVLEEADLHLSLAVAGARQGIAANPAPNGSSRDDSSRDAAKHPVVPTEQARQWANLFSAAADGLAHLHARGVIHRDLKPGNLMLTTDAQRLVITDLGLAQVRDRTQGLTQESTRWLGTLRYCSPEQLRWNLLDIDERADVYGLGAALYEMVTLRPLFDGDSESRLIEQILHEEPREPRFLVPDIDRDLNEIVMHCLEKDRGQRYASADALAEDLRRFCQGLPVSVRPLTKMQRLSRWARNNPRLAALTMLLASLLLLVSVGASTGMILLSRLLKETRQAQATARDQTARAHASELQRVALEIQEDAADFSMLREQVRADRFVEANQVLTAAHQRVLSSDTLHQRLPSWNRLEKVLAFYMSCDRTWNAWGEEEYAKVMLEAGQALGNLNAQERENWWESLPTDDLDPDEQLRFAREVYRVLMLYSAVHTVAGSVALERTKMESGPGREAASTRAATLLAKAFPPLLQARSWESHHGRKMSLASEIMGKVTRELLLELGRDADTPFLTDLPVEAAESDNYFLGLMYFVIERSTSSNNPLCASEPKKQEQDFDPKSDGLPQIQGLLSQRLAWNLSQIADAAEGDVLNTSEHLLRMAAGSERRFWPSFALGRTLFFQGRFAEAELAFVTCISLRPDYARGYEQRALMRALQARETQDAERKMELRQLARDDSNRAIVLAEHANDPATYWTRADLHFVLQEPEAAIAYYLQAVEAEPDLEQKVNRRNNLECAKILAESLVADESAPSVARAQASELLKRIRALRLFKPQQARTGTKATGNSPS